MSIQDGRMKAPIHAERERLKVERSLPRERLNSTPGDNSNSVTVVGPGNNPFYPKAWMYEAVESYAAAGFPIPKICKLIRHPVTDLPISEPTLIKYFGSILDTALINRQITLDKTLYQEAIGKAPEYDPETGKLIHAGYRPNLAAIQWYEKSRLGMKEGMSVELTGKDGTPLTAPPAVVILLPDNKREYDYDLEYDPREGIFLPKDPDKKRAALARREALDAEIDEDRQVVQSENDSSMNVLQQAKKKSNK